MQFFPKGVPDGLVRVPRGLKESFLDSNGSFGTPRGDSSIYYCKIAHLAGQHRVIVVRHPILHNQVFI